MGCAQSADPPAPNRQALVKEKYGKKSGPDPLPPKSLIDIFVRFLLVLGIFRAPRAQEIIFWLRVEPVNAQPEAGFFTVVCRVQRALGGKLQAPQHATGLTLAA